MKPIERLLEVEGLELFIRETGDGAPLIVVHGGPDFDHAYLLPDMDRLAESFRLVYYDQRGRGRSRRGFRLEDVSVARFVEDLDAVRRDVGVGRAAVLGHSWGAHLAMRYAIAHPDRLSHLLLLNPAPATHAGYLGMLAEREKTWARHRERLQALSGSPAFADGDPDTVSAFYALLFRDSFVRVEDAARLAIRSSREDILVGRQVEDRLMEDAYAVEGFSILPQLARIEVAALVIHGELDFIPLASAAEIATALRCRLEVIPGSGHFTYIDATDRVHRLVGDFVR